MIYYHIESNHFNMKRGFERANRAFIISYRNSFELSRRAAGMSVAILLKDPWIRREFKGISFGREAYEEGNGT
jgi:hypothetical protein